jgi:Tol biopolymer transport system component/DNA-binding winged helix-turn-helix (wHTH) protein
LRPPAIYPLSGMDISNSEKQASDRLLIGQCIVVLSSREVHVPGVRRVRRLTPKSIGVLLVLARNAGQVVTRDELFAEVWPDTMPTNDVLTQAVTQLRKAFASGETGSDGATYIETIAKTGYRLLAPVSWEGGAAFSVAPQSNVEAAVSAATEEDTTHAADKPSRSTRRRVRRYVLLSVGLALLVSTAVMFWLLWTGADAVDPDVVSSSGTRVVGSPERPYRLITSTAAFETHPALSPDGSLVVFAKEDGAFSSLWIQSTGNAAPVKLVAPPVEASDRFPAWSPDGREIAFARFLPGDVCEVLLVSATGGGARRVARCDGTEMLSFDWSPDGRSMIFGSMTGSHASRGIRTLDLASGRWSSLSYEMGSDDFDYAPHYSPDGKQIGFVRNPQVGDLWVMDADGRNAKRVTGDAAEIRGWSWLGSAEMVFGRRVDSESRLYRLDVATGVLRDMGVDDADSPSVSQQGRTLAFKRDHPRYALFRFPVGDEGGPPQRLFASSGRDGQPVVSPDGKRLAFTSNRSGTFALWWGALDDPDSLQVIEGFRPEARQPMDWSADGRSLLVAGRDDDGMPGIYEVKPEEGHWKKLPVPASEPLQAIYGAQPGTVLVVERDAGERMRLTLFDREHGWKRLASLDGISQVRLDRAGDRILFTRLAYTGLWQVGTALAQSSVRLLGLEAPTRWRYRTWAVTGSGAIHYLHIGPHCASQLTTIESAGQTQCLDARRFSSRNGFSMAPDGSAAFVALAIADGTDIGVMHVPERAARPVIGAAKWLPWLRKPLS